MFEAIMDKLQFHYHTTKLFRKLNPKFWNPEISWKNKWKNGNKEEGEKFPFSSTLLVSFTDGWHLMKTCRWWSLVLLLILLSLVTTLQWWMIVLVFVLQKLIFSLTFWFLGRGS